MKKRLQFVALILTLTLAAPPVFANTACSQRACAHHAAMDCCPHPGAASMPMTMDPSCGQSALATASTQCTGAACCRISAATIPALPAPKLVPADVTVTVLPTTWWTPVALIATRRPPGPRPDLPTARYILFRDFRI